MGDMTIVKDAKLRSFIEKKTSFREQNCINWSITESLCKEPGAKYKYEWSGRKEWILEL